MMQKSGGERRAAQLSICARRATGAERRNVEPVRWVLARITLGGAVIACSGGGQDITELTRGGSEAVEATAVNAAQPAPWAETPIIFRSDRGSPTLGDLYAMAPDGTHVRRLTTGGDFFMPQWSPNGDRVACRWVSGDNAEVGLLKADGGAPVALTRGESAEQYSRPVQWSPDGQQLGFVSNRDGGLKMWITTPSGNSAWPLAITGGAPLDAVWSLPDARLVAYAAYAVSQPEAADHGESSSRDIWVAPADGSARPINLTQGRVFAPGYLRWSPDGRRIAFSGYAVLPDGSLELAADHAAGGYSPPDDELYIIDAETAELTRLTDNDRVDHVPAWSPDGQALLFSSYRDGDGDIWVLPIDAPEMARNLIDDGEFSDQEDHLADWYWDPQVVDGSRSR